MPWISNAWDELDGEADGEAGASSNGREDILVYWLATRCTMLELGSPFERESSLEDESTRKGFRLRGGRGTEGKPGT